MLHKAGKKIILLSTILLYAGIAASLAAGLFMIWNGTQTGVISVAYYRGGYLTHMGVNGGGRAVAAGFLVIIFGSLSSWLTALLLRAFGELSTDTRAIREQLECTHFEAELVEDELNGPQPDTQVNADDPAQPKPKPRKPDRPQPPAADKPQEPAAR